MVLANNPIYRTNLGAYCYGVSAPSSVVIDMVLAGIPTAVWRDQDGMMDTRHYDGLTNDQFARRLAGVPSRRIGSAVR